jgi:hypothetical protein
MMKNFNDRKMWLFRLVMISDLESLNQFWIVCLFLISDHEEKGRNRFVQQLKFW